MCKPYTPRVDVGIWYTRGFHWTSLGPRYIPVFAHGPSEEVQINATSSYLELWLQGLRGAGNVRA